MSVLPCGRYIWRPNSSVTLALGLVSVLLSFEANKTLLRTVIRPVNVERCRFMSTTQRKACTSISIWKFCRTNTCLTIITVQVLDLTEKSFVRAVAVIVYTAMQKLYTVSQKKIIFLHITLHIVDVRLTCLINITYLLTYLLTSPKC